LRNEAGNKLPLNKYGTVGGSCNDFTMDVGEYITTFNYLYESSGVVNISMISNEGRYT